jgi:hypothetical protein
MSPLKKVLPLILFLAGSLLGQGTPADCTFPASGSDSFTSATTGTSYSNSNNFAPCRAFEISYSTTGFSVISIQFETSPDNSSWTAVPNTVCSSTVQPPCVIDGANPSTTTGNQTLSVKAYGKFVRLNVTTATGSGTISTKMYGYKGLSAKAPGGAGGGGTPVASAYPLASTLGFRLNGTDETALFNTTLAAGPTTIIIDCGKTLTLAGNIVIPASSNWLAQTDVIGTGPSNRLTGACPPGMSTYPDHIRPVGASTLALNCTSNECILASARATLEIDHLVLTKTVVDSTNHSLITITGTVLRLHDCYIGDQPIFTSTTTNTPGAGAQVFTVQAGGVHIAVGQLGTARSRSTPSDYMTGTVAYSGTTLTLTVAANFFSGSTPHSDWDVLISGSAYGDGIYLGGTPGTSCCTGTNTDPYQAYSATIIEHNTFSGFNVPITAQGPNVNAVIIRGNVFFGGNLNNRLWHIQNIGAGGSFNVGWIIDGNVFQEQYTICDINLRAAQKNTFTNNKRFDGDSNSNFVCGTSTATQNVIDRTTNTADQTQPFLDAGLQGRGNYLLPGISDAPPSVNNASCAGATIGSGSTNGAGTITGLPTGTCTVILTFDTTLNTYSTTGWRCAVSDQTTGNLFRQTASSATTATFSGVSVSGDVLSYGPCQVN